MSGLTEISDIKYFFWNTEHFIVDNTSRLDEKEVTFEFNEQGARYNCGFGQNTSAKYLTWYWDDSQKHDRNVSKYF